MTSTAAPAPETEKVRTRRGRRQRPRQRRPVLWVALGVFVVAVSAAGYWAYWLGSGLLEASRTVQERAAVAQSELQQFRDTLKVGDEEAAAAHLEAGQAALDEAKAAALVDQVRIAKGLPYVGNTVRDLDHLLAAAGIMTASGRDALVVYQKFSGEDSELFDNGKFSIPAIRQAQQSVAAIMKSVERAESHLRKVTGNGPKGEQALEKKRSALDQIASLRAEVTPLQPVLQALPSAVGAEGRVKYLVAIMNPAEMRASGGAPLSLMFVSFKNGKMSIPLQGTTSSITRGGPPGLQGDSPELVWPRVKNDPFQPALGEPQRFVNASFNPDFSVSAEQMRRATPTFFGQKTDGVIALDLVAISKLMKVTGPIESRYGWLTPENVVQKLLVRAYKEQGSAVTARQQENEKLMSVMMAHLVGGGGLIDKARALGEAMPGRHLQLYFRDPRLQQLVVEKKIGGIVPDPRVGNLTAVYTQNGNGNKLDVFQKRVVKEVVSLRKDGSAVVRRTVTLKNPTPPYTGVLPDRRRGYDTRWATNLVINLMPDGSRVIKQPEVSLASTVKTGTDQAGRTFAKAAVVLPPDSEATISWTYVVKRAAVKRGNAWQFTNFVAPQGILNVPALDLTITGPDGWSIHPVRPDEGWKSVDGGLAIRLPMDMVRAPQVRMVRQ